jgi:hypothetical protein
MIPVIAREVNSTLDAAMFFVTLLVGFKMKLEEGFTTLLKEADKDAFGRKEVVIVTVVN